jgi:hypothetical protein
MGELLNLPWESSCTEQTMWGTRVSGRERGPDTLSGEGTSLRDSVRAGRAGIHLLP